MEKRCPTCGNKKDVELFHKQPRNKDGYDVCKKCQSEGVGRSRRKYGDRVREYNREYGRRNKDKVQKWNRQNRERHLLSRALRDAKIRACHRGVPFTLTESDLFIPEVCPVLGIPLSIGRGHARPNSPSLDCVIPSLGYVPGNVLVISHRANTIKQNATAEELRKVADWIEKMTQSASSSLPKVD